MCVSFFIEASQRREKTTSLMSNFGLLCFVVAYKIVFYDFSHSSTRESSAESSVGFSLRSQCNPFIILDGEKDKKGCEYDEQSKKC